MEYKNTFCPHDGHVNNYLFVLFITNALDEYLYSCNCIFQPWIVIQSQFHSADAFQPNAHQELMFMLTDTNKDYILLLVEMIVLI